MYQESHFEQFYQPFKAGVAALLTYYAILFIVFLVSTAFGPLLRLRSVTHRPGFSSLLWLLLLSASAMTVALQPRGHRAWCAHWHGCRVLLNTHLQIIVHTKQRRYCK